MNEILWPKGYITQESEIGKAAQEMAQTKSNPMLNDYQEWIEGLACAAAERGKH